MRIFFSFSFCVCFVFLINLRCLFLCVVVVVVVSIVVPKQSSPVLVTNIRLADNLHHVINKIATQTGCSSVEA